MDEASAKCESLSRSAVTLSEVSQELANWVPVLRRVAEAEALRSLAFGHNFEVTSESVRTVIAARRLRDQYFGDGMSDGAWTVALELFANRLAGRKLTIEQLGLAVDLPVATVIHWLDWLSGRGTVSSLVASEEQAGAEVDLTDTGADQIRSYLVAALQFSPWVQ